jgi:hypothetical protein
VDGAAFRNIHYGGTTMNAGRGCLLWALGVPLPVVLILYFLFHR